MWQNRIVRYSEEPPDQLLANPKNWRSHPGSQAEALRGVLEDVGVVQNVIANVRTGFLIDGHLRVMEALKAGQPTIPVTWVDLSEEEEALVLATLDPLSALAGTDAAQLDALLRDVSTDSPAVQQMLADLAEEAGVVPEAGAGGDEFDATPEETGPTRTQVGDLWQIGPHRLLVGDCTDPRNVERLMGGERADCVFTSPPYDQQRTYEGNMAADWRGLVSGACLTMLSHLEADAQVFINLGLVHRDGRVVRYWDGLIADLEAADWPLFGWYVWDKLNGMPGDWNGRLAPAHEWVFHFTQVPRRHLELHKTVKTKHAGKKVGSTERYPDGTLKPFNSPGLIQAVKIPDSVVRLSPQKPDAIVSEHPATFPVALPQTYMETYGGDLWYEPFLGSGTSIVAAHRTGRRCYGLELEPRYADVVLRRAEAEGLVPVKVE